MVCYLFKKRLFWYVYCRHDYSLVPYYLDLTSLSNRKTQVNLSFFVNCINCLIDAPENSNGINFRVPVYNSRKFIIFTFPFVTTNYSVNNTQSCFWPMKIPSIYYILNIFICSIIYCFYSRCIYNYICIYLSLLFILLYFRLARFDWK